MITKYYNIVFDLGGVIVDIDPQACIDELNKIGLYDAAKIIAVCRGIRHILTPVAWIICTALVAYTTIYLNR